MTSTPLSALVISPSPAVHGGVSTFIETMKSHLTNCTVTSFYVGSIQERQENRLVQAKRLLLTPFIIARVVRAQKFDIIHINPSFNTKSLIRDGLILLALRLINFRSILVYFHGWDWQCAHRIEQTTILRCALLWLLNGTSRIGVLSPEFQQWLALMGVSNSRIVLMRTMFEGAAFQAIESKYPALQRRKILYMSRLIREKGIYELLGAFLRIANEFSDVDLVLAGDGEEREALQILAACCALGDRISFLGYVQGTEKFLLLKNCFVFALPTHLSEGMPVALLEAMAAGKTLLTSNKGGITHIISEPENGLVLNEINIDTVEGALRKLLNDPEYCKKTGLHNATYAWENFEAAKVTKEIESLYQEIACHQ